MTTIKTPNVTWLDIKNPSPKELKYLSENYNIHQVIIDGLEKPTVRSRAEELNGYIYLVMHFPVFNETKKISEPVEIDFILTPDTLISVRYEALEPLEEFLKKCKSINSAHKKNMMNKSSIYLFHHIVKNIYEFASRQLDHVDEKINDIEEAIFSGRQKEMLLALSLARSDVLNFLRTIKPQDSVLESLLARADFFEKNAKPYIIDLLGEQHRVLNQAENNRETIEGLQTTNASLLEHRTNEVMKVLTIITFIALPLTLIANVFGMSSKNLPMVDRPYFFWIILCIMAASIGGFIMIFKHKKWL